MLSPFRAQVDALTRSVFEEFRGSQLRRLRVEAQLLIGTAHSFQGEERWLMLISMAIDNSYHAASLRFLEREDVFNVAITRAKDRQYVFHSLDSNKLKPDSMLSEYLMHIDTENESYAIDSVERDRFANEVVHELCNKNDQVSVGGRVAGVPIDIVIQRDDLVLAVDLIGYPGDMQVAVHTKKALMLSRAGLDLIPLGYYEWEMRRDDCVTMLNLLLRHEIEKTPEVKESIENSRSLEMYSYVKRNQLRYFGERM
ncbi:AAA domain-containing protein [Rubritalea spongiae]|uniref:AAA domain-containing protein n=1 Tax=Rubritalea spongiae TaxID=430797 RepID=UPI00360C0856